MKIPNLSIEQLLEAGVHLGHKTLRWNPKMKKYIFGKRDSVHIIDLTQTLELTNKALEKIYDVISNNGKILFISTKKQASESIAELAKSTGQYFVNYRWLGGMLTNWGTISNSIKKLQKIEIDLKAENRGFTKKELLKMGIQRDKLQRSLGGISEMKKIPDLVFIIDISGSFEQEITSMIEGITPLLDDPITSNFRFGLAVIGKHDSGHHVPAIRRHSDMVTNFVPADEFLEYLQAMQLMDDGGIEPSIDATMWSMDGSYPFAWGPTSQKVIILMTDEVAQTITGKNVSQVNLHAVDNGYQIFVFALPEHHASFLQMVRGEADRLYTPTANSETVFLQIKQIFEDLCISEN